MVRPTGPRPASFSGHIHVPVGLAHLLRHILAERRAPAPSETILAKVLAAGQKKSMEAAIQQLVDLGMQPPLPPPPCK